MPWFFGILVFFLQAEERAAYSVSPTCSFDLTPTVADLGITPVAVDDRAAIQFKGGETAALVSNAR